MSENKYNAFISYRHNERDSMVASSLQTQLERFHIPKAIRAKTGIEKINRIFRDQNELELTSDLAQGIDEALEQSDFLIVILSEAYNESQWCLHEIEQFLKTHDSDHILAVLSQGEPPGIFPDLLLHKKVTKLLPDGSEVTETVDTEPLACDYRMDSKRAQRIELPRLVSAMLGCEYDDLVLRNETWRRNRMLTLFGIISVLAAAAIAWLLYSNARIRENYRQAQINESKTIASNSLEELANGMRLQALHTALTAMPAEGDYPITPEAEYALGRSSLAYKLPYHITQTNKIDLNADIRTMAVDAENSYLDLVDSMNTIHFFHMPDLTETGSYHVKTTDRNWKPVILNGIHYVKTTAGIASVNPDGSVNWVSDLRYKSGSVITPSHDGQLLICTDVIAMDIMDLTGEPVASFLIPEEKRENGYIEDFRLSPDDSWIAVLIRYNGGTYELGFFEMETGHYTEYGQIIKPAGFEFIDSTHLVTMTNTATELSYTVGSEIRINPNDMILRCIEKTETVWETSVGSPLRSSCTQLNVLAAEGRTYLLADTSDTIFLLDAENGELMFSQRTGVPILTVLDAFSGEIHLITEDGQLGTCSLMDGSITLDKMFPDRLKEAAVIYGVTRNFNQYAVIRDGNLYWYSTAFDDDITLFGGLGFYDPADEAVLGETTIAVRSGKTLYLYDRESMEEIASVSTDLEHPWIGEPAQGIQDRIVLAVIDLNTASITIETRSMEDLSLLSSMKLSIQDYYAKTGYYNTLTSSISESLYSVGNLLYTSYYNSPSPLAWHNDRLYFFSRNETCLLHIADLSDGTEETLPVSLPQGFKAHLLVEPPKKEMEENPYIVVSEDGSTAMIAAENEEEEAVYPLLIDVSSGASLLGANPLGNLVLAGNGKRIAVSAAETIDVYDPEGALLHSIPYSGTICIGLHYVNDRLFAVYPNGTLYEYGMDGSTVNVIRLSFDETYQMKPVDITLFVHGEELFVKARGSVDFVSLTGNATRPISTLGGAFLSYDEKTDRILVFSYDGKGINNLYYPAYLPHYTSDQLIAKARSETER